MSYRLSNIWRLWTSIFWNIYDLLCKQQYLLMLSIYIGQWRGFTPISQATCEFYGARPFSSLTFFSASTREKSSKMSKRQKYVVSEDDKLVELPYRRRLISPSHVLTTRMKQHHLPKPEWVFYYYCSGCSLLADCWERILFIWSCSDKRWIAREKNPTKEKAGFGYLAYFSCFHSILQVWNFAKKWKPACGLWRWKHCWYPIAFDSIHLYQAQGCGCFQWQIFYE